MDSLAKANGTFAINLLKKLCEESPSHNVFFSPLSVSSSLAMLFLGAKGDTAAQMAQVLSLNRGEDIHWGFQSLVTKISKPGTEYLLRTANRLFGEKIYDFLSEFKESCQQFYQAEPERLSFAEAIEAPRQRINALVAEKTEDKVLEVLPDKSVDSLTKLVLINAIYFKGKCSKQFNEKYTGEKPFRISKNENRQVQMMYQHAQFLMSCIKEMDTQVLELPYVGGELSMINLLPDDDVDLSMVENALSYDDFTSWTKLSVMDREDVEIFLPRFKLEENYNLESVLGSLGITNASDKAEADFSGMSSKRNLSLSNFERRFFVEVNEKGTKAAAVTAVVAVAKCASTTLRFNADHPFLFIQHNRTKSIMFCGRFSSP
ncbi:serpin B6-like [Orycteropus afer afer]|uniref:Serpin B6-like n=1 Tax=Orycteropus afer afer TaxID=1230840 RepID=A0A8B6ZEQ0_ORYAF|nr:serpin B6-like [Orycteropus afer afer]